MSSSIVLVEPSELLKSKGLDCPPDDICDTYPCCHTSSLDPDYLENVHDDRFNTELNRKVWYLWHNPKMRDTIPDSEREVYEAKFERCQRIKDNLPKIRREIQIRAFQLCGIDVSLADSYDYGPFPEIEEANRKLAEEFTLETLKRWQEC